jgi:hypothetical protein
MIGERPCVGQQVPALAAWTAGVAAAGCGKITDCPKRSHAMEAEQLNQIAGKIANLRDRSADLRRYL